MAIFCLETQINAPIERCFLLSLSVNLHEASVSETNERAIGGISTGLMKLNDMVTWEARHFGLKFHMTTKIPLYEKPNYFVSEMSKGPFKKLYHQHLFRKVDGETMMTDVFEMKAPFGILGKAVVWLFLKNYMKQFLVKRNQFIKRTAESDNWREYIT